jgi:hypothetical protein
MRRRKNQKYPKFLTLGRPKEKQNKESLFFLDASPFFRQSITLFEGLRISSFRPSIKSIFADADEYGAQVQ